VSLDPHHTKVTRTVLVWSLTDVWDGDQRHAERLADAFEVDVGGTFFPISARAGFSFGQFLDFLLGLLTVDLAGDDAPQPSQQ
jgi:hypothetical protein